MLSTCNMVVQLLTATCTQAAADFNGWYRSKNCTYMAEYLYAGKQAKPQFQIILGYRPPPPLFLLPLAYPTLMKLFCNAIKNIQQCMTSNSHAACMTVVTLHGFTYPSCLHTTVASLESQLLPHTVPHIPLTHTSTLPSLRSAPPTRRILPLPKHCGRTANIVFV